MSFAIEEIKKALEGFGVVTTPDEDPNQLFVGFYDDNTRFTMMMVYSEESRMMFMTVEIPVEFSVEKEDSAFLTAAYINRSLNIGSATYLPNINRIIFRFYFNMEEDNLNFGMFFYCYYEAIDLVRRFYPTVALLEKGAVLPKDVVVMANSNI